MEYNLKRLQELPRGTLLGDEDLVLVDITNDSGGTYTSSKVKIVDALSTRNVRLSKTGQPYELTLGNVIDAYPTFDQTNYRTQEDANQLFTDSLVNLADAIDNRGSNIFGPTLPSLDPTITRPISPGTIWINSNNFQMYVYAKDISGNMYWVGLTPSRLL